MPTAQQQVPYSEHSSFSELHSFVSWLRPSEIIPSVLTSASASNNGAHEQQVQEQVACKGSISLARYHSGECQGAKCRSLLQSRGLLKHETTHWSTHWYTAGAGRAAGLQGRGRAPGRTADRCVGGDLFTSTKENLRGMRLAADWTPLGKEGVGSWSTRDQPPPLCTRLQGPP